MGDGRSNMWTWAEDLVIWLKPSFPMVQSGSGLNLVPVRLPKYFGFINLWRESEAHFLVVIFGDFKVDITDYC